VTRAFTDVRRDRRVYVSYDINAIRGVTDAALDNFSDLHQYGFFRLFGRAETWKEPG
jgi:hypothetical protein